MARYDACAAGGQASLINANLKGKKVMKQYGSCHQIIGILVILTVFIFFGFILTTAVRPANAGPQPASMYEMSRDKAATEFDYWYEVVYNKLMSNGSNVNNGRAVTQTAARAAAEITAARINARVQ
jgi:hypothetical protein